MAEKDKKISFVKQAANPRLHIIKQADGAFVINYGQNDIHNRKNIYNRADLDQEIQKLFGYEGWEEYKRQNREDLYRKKGPPTEDGKLQVPTLFPVHVAYALEEFKDTFNPRDYELVGVPGENFLTIEAGTSWWQTITALTPKDLWEKYQDEVIDPIVDAPLPDWARHVQLVWDQLTGKDRAEREGEQAAREGHPSRGKEADEKRANREAMWAARVRAIKAEDLGIDPDISKKIQVVQKMRKAFFGGEGQGSVLKIAMYQPLEVLSNKDVIARVENEFKKKFDIQTKFEDNFPVNHPKGKYWNKDFKPSLLAHIISNAEDLMGTPETSVYSTGEQTDAYVVGSAITSQALNQTPMLNEGLLLENTANVIMKAIDNAAEAALNMGRLASGAKKYFKKFRSLADLKEEARLLSETNPALGHSDELGQWMNRADDAMWPIDDIRNFAKALFRARNRIILDAIAQRVRPTYTKYFMNNPMMQKMKSLLKGVDGAREFLGSLKTFEDLKRVSLELGPYDLRPLDGSGGIRLEKYVDSVDSWKNLPDEFRNDWVEHLADTYRKSKRATVDPKVRPGPTKPAAPRPAPPRPGARAGESTLDELVDADTITLNSVQPKLGEAMADLPLRNAELMQEVIEGELRLQAKFEELTRLLGDLKGNPDLDPKVLKLFEKLMKQQDSTSKSLLQMSKNQADLARQLKKMEEGGGLWKWGAGVIGITWIVCRDGERCALTIDAAMKGDWPSLFALLSQAVQKAIDDLLKALREITGIDGEDTPEEVTPEEAAAKQQEKLEASKQISANFEYYLLPKGWRNLSFLTTAEQVLAERIGAKTDILKSLAKDKEDSPSAQSADALAAATGQPSLAAGADSRMEQTPLNEVNALFFGHSQTYPLSKKLRAQIKDAGGKTKFIAHPFDDAGMAREIKNVKGKFTHAYLFLNGNSYPPYDNLEASLYKNQKKEIINYVQTSLGVPKDNILVVLPPVNNASYKEEDLRARLKKERDVALNLTPQVQGSARKSRGRGAELNPAAREYFESLGVKVADPIISTNPADFRDGLHISSLSSLSRDFQAGELSNLTPKPQAPPAAAPASRDEQTISNGEEVDILQHLAEGKVTIVNFTNSSWCDACITLKPILEKAASNPKVALRKINIETWEEPVVAQYGIDSIPYWVVFDPAGKLVASSEANNKDKLVDLIVSDNTHDFRDVQNVVDKVLEKTGVQKQEILPGDRYAVVGSKPKVEYDPNARPKKINYWNTAPGKRDIVNIISEEAVSAGVDRDFMLASAQVESGMNPFNGMKLDREGNIVSPLQGGEQYHGMYAVSRKWFWKHSKLTDKQKFKDFPNMVYEPRHHAREFTRIVKRLFKSAKRFMPKTQSIANIDESEEWILYLMWQQGPTGVLKSLQNDDNYKWGTHNWGQNYFGPAGWSPLGREIQKNYKQLEVEVKKYPELKGKWHKIPADNEVMAKNIELRNQITAKMFRDGWRSLYSSIKRKALRKVPKNDTNLAKGVE